jgi:iojap-like ribosome-associated protein
MEMRELAFEAAKILDKKGAMDIMILDVTHMTSITEYFLIVSGRNVQAVRTLAEDLEDRMAELGVEARRRDGAKETKWIVLDYAGVIVHIFHPEEREFYNIERLWQDGTNQVEFIPED